MAWLGVWLVRRQPGESDEEAVDRASAFVGSPDGVPWIVGDGDDEEGPDDDEFITDAAQVARSVNPALEMVEESRHDGHLTWATLDEEGGPVFVTLYPGAVQLEAGEGWSDPPDADGAGFHAMWSLATAIAETFDCVAHDPDYGDVFDLTLGRPTPGTPTTGCDAQVPLSLRPWCGVWRTVTRSAYL